MVNLKDILEIISEIINEIEGTNYSVMLNNEYQITDLGSGIKFTFPSQEILPVKEIEKLIEPIIMRYSFLSSFSDFLDILLIGFIDGNVSVEAKEMLKKLVRSYIKNTRMFTDPYENRRIDYVRK